MTREKFRTINQKLGVNKAAISEIKTQLKPKKPRDSVKIKGKDIVVRRPKIVANLPSKVVLTDSTW